MIGYVVVMGIASLVALASPLPERITLLPDQDGSAGEVVVTANNDAAAVRLREAYTVAKRGSGTSLTIERESPAEVTKRYANLLAGLPPRPVTYLLYFELGSDRLTAESLAQIVQLKQILRDWPAPELRLVGHTDRVGKIEDNDVLSMARARKVRDLLLQEGFDPMSLEVTGRGERALLIPTQDEVAESRNRRVEIIVR